MLERFIYGRERVEVKNKVETHLPKIECPDVVNAEEPFEVSISISKHPSRVEHSIRHVDVFFVEEGRAFNPIRVANVQFTPEYTEAKVVIKLKLKKSGTIIALAYCNLHGLWESCKDVKVR